MSTKNIVIAVSKKNIIIAAAAILVIAVLICVHAWQSSTKTTGALQTDDSSSQAAASPAKSDEKSSQANGTSSKENLVISQFGVQAANPSAADLEYEIVDNKATFTSKQLLAKSANCSVKAASAGIIARVPATDFVSIQKYPGDYKQVGEYYYVFTSPQAVCSDVAGIVEPQETATAAVKELLTSLVAIPVN